MSKLRPKKTSDSALTLARHVPGLLLAAVVILLVATPIIPSEAAVPEGSHATLGMLWCLLLLGWSAAALAGLAPAQKPGWTMLAALGLIAIHSLSAVLMSWSGGGGRPALNTLWIWVNYGSAAFLLGQVLVSAAQCRAVVAVMVALGICLSMHAYYQYFVSQPAFQRAYQADPEKYLKAEGYDTDKNSLQRKQLEDRLFSREPLATFSLTNSLAGFLAPWLIVAAGIALGELSSGGYRRALMAAILAALFMSGGLLLTKSRTAILAASLGGVLLLLYGRRGGYQVGWKIPIAAAGVLVVIGLGIVIAGGLDAEVLSEAPKALLYRLEYWRSTAAMIADYPLLGVGPGRFQAIYAQYKLPQASESVSDPHNFLLEVWATAGTPALVLMLGALAVFVFELWQQLSTANRRPMEPSPPADSTNPTTLGAAASYHLSIVYAAGGIGLLFGIAMASMSGHFILKSYSGGLVGLLLLGLPAAAAFLWAVSGWVRAGELRAPPLVIGLMVLGVNFLFAGALSFPGVAQTAWILIPLALQLNPALQRDGNVSREPAPRNPLAIASLAVASLLAVACYFTSYAPVLNSSLPMTSAELIPFQSTDQLNALLRDAAAKDPWSAAPWERLAEVHLAAWLRNGWDQDLADFTQAADEYSRREVPSSRAAQARSRWYLQVYARSKKPADLDLALAASRLAAARYPASALVHAELAAAWKLADDDSAAQMEAREALRLDQLNPHQEFKLRRQTLPRYRWDEAQQTVVPDSPDKSAEQVMLALRKGLRG